jgi:hypothetical protein
MTSTKAKADRQRLAKTGFATHLNGRKNLPIFISARKFAPGGPKPISAIPLWKSQLRYNVSLMTCPNLGIGKWFSDFPITDWNIAATNAFQAICQSPIG